MGNIKESNKGRRSSTFRSETRSLLGNRRTIHESIRSNTIPVENRVDFITKMLDEMNVSEEQNIVTKLSDGQIDTDKNDGISDPMQSDYTHKKPIKPRNNKSISHLRHGESNADDFVSNQFSNLKCDSNEHGDPFNDKQFVENYLTLLANLHVKDFSVEMLKRQFCHMCGKRYRAQDRTEINFCPFCGVFVNYSV
ncbi:hypothetical protein ACOME3_001451 [Neoechinorhynchus agilis]